MNESPIDLVSAALVECQAKLKSVHKDSENPGFRSKYASLDVIIETTREAISAAGLAIQQPVTIKDGIVTVQTWIRHKSGQFLDGGSMSMPIEDSTRNTDAQVAGSLITYLKRYSWAANLAVSTGEDDDGNSAPKGAQRPAASQPPKPLAKADEATRMRALNFLQAAPGQPLRNLVQQFFVHKGWIKGEQNPEDWPLDKVPTGRHALTEIGNSIAMFERQQVDQNDNLPFEEAK